MLSDMGGYNNIGIRSEFDKERIAHLFKIGIAAAFIVLFMPKDIEGMKAVLTATAVIRNALRIRPSEQACCSNNPGSHRSRVSAAGRPALCARRLLRDTRIRVLLQAR